MEELIRQWVNGLPLPFLFIIVAVSLYYLAKGADILVCEAVSLSLNWGVSKMVIGVTIVSIGTTLPEVAVSVFAAAKGNPGLAMGNSVGSIICNSGLILGLAALVAPLPITRSVVNRQGWIQVGAGVLLVLACLPFSNLGSVFVEGGRLPRGIGMFFLVLLAAYLFLSVQWTRQASARSKAGNEDAFQADSKTVHRILLKMSLGIALVLITAQILIPSIEESAGRLGVPDAIIGATLVALGTSLPELMTALTAARKGHGDLAIGNVIGADILNVLLVSGAAAALTPGGLATTGIFFVLYFPAILFIFFVLRIGFFFSRESLGRAVGAVLVGAYLIVTVLSYIL